METATPEGVALRLVVQLDGGFPQPTTLDAPTVIAVLAIGTNVAPVGCIVCTAFLGFDPKLVEQRLHSGVELYWLLGTAVIALR